MDKSQYIKTNAEVFDYSHHSAKFNPRRGLINPRRSLIKPRRSLIKPRRGLNFYLQPEKL